MDLQMLTRTRAEERTNLNAREKSSNKAKPNKREAPTSEFFSFAISTVLCALHWRAWCRGWCELSRYFPYWKFISRTYWPHWGCIFSTWLRFSFQKCELCYSHVRKAATKFPIESKWKYDLRTKITILRMRSRSHSSSSSIWTLNAFRSHKLLSLQAKLKSWPFLYNLTPEMI